MKKQIKKIAAVAMAMALAAASAVPAFAASSATFTGQIDANDLEINLDLPASGSLTLKPYAKNQIMTARGMAFHNKYARDDDERVGYVITMAGYTCVATPKGTAKTDAITVTSIRATDAATKSITLRAEIGDPTVASPQALTTDAATFDGIFSSDPTDADKKSDQAEAIMAINEATKATYDGKTNTAYTTVDDVTPVAVAADGYAPFRISGEMNEKATWTAGDKVVVVPIFSVEVSIGAAD